MGELAAELPVSRPAVSQHLKVLVRVGLVTCEAVGTRRVYRLDPQGVDALRTYFEHFWTQALTGFSQAVEAPPREDNDT